jgi:uncharacterized protein YbjQ (UPF0145 family)
MTTEQINKKKFKVLGVVGGNDIVRISLGGVRNPTITYAERIEEAREATIKKMMEKASKLGANAIVDLTLPHLKE